jgi:prevent-host-death family protein
MGFQPVMKSQTLDEIIKKTQETLKALDCVIVKKTELQMRKQFGSAQRIVTATEMRRDFSVVVRRVNKRHEHALIQNKGSSVAVLLSVAEYDELMRYKRLAVFDKFTREFGGEIEKQGLSEEEVMAELEETKREVFRERYAKPAK